MTKATQSQSSTRTTRIRTAREIAHSSPRQASWRCLKRSTHNRNCQRISTVRLGRSRGSRRIKPPSTTRSHRHNLLCSRLIAQWNDWMLAAAILIARSRSLRCTTTELEEAWVHWLARWRCDMTSGPSLHCKPVQQHMRAVSRQQVDKPAQPSIKVDLASPRAPSSVSINRSGTIWKQRAFSAVS